MRRLFLALLPFLVLASGWTTDVVVPNEKQREWAECELGVMYHFDMQVFNPDYEWRHWGTHPDASTFNPTELNTDQWLDAASKIGAKYAVLVAKHCCGFSLWPTEAHGYSVKNSPWRDGQGDIVRDFIESCKKYDIKPAIYASTTANGYYWVDNPGLVQPGGPYTQEEYNAVVEKQLTELWSNYGDLFEIWFDGGVLSPERGGAGVAELVQKLQPDAIAFQGPYGHPNLIRWVGNESGLAPYPCWATADSTTNSDGVVAVEGMNGRPDAPFWCPGESDCTLRHNSTRQGGWEWAPGEDDRIFTVSELMEKYETSVGRNTNMLLGLVVDPRGLVPEGDVQRLEEFGKAIKEKYGSPVATASGKGRKVEIKFDKPTVLNRAVIQEDISYGERVLEYSLKGRTADGKWVDLALGSNIGHKHIDLFQNIELTAVRLEVNSCKAEPVIRNLAVYGPVERSAQRARFEDGNYAMFVHFGLYSQLEGVWKGKTYFGNAEWIMNGNQAGISVEDYKALAKDFNPSEFDAEALVQLAKDAGMKYIIITSKHHEGFAMFDSDACDFNVHDATPCGRDLMKELADACHKAGLGIGFYYSQFQDWTAPGGGGGPSVDASGRKVSFDEYYHSKVVPQVKELLTNYGEIQLIWFDTPGDMQAKYSEDLVNLVHELQPGALVSSRVGNGLGDYETLGDMEVPLKNMNILWEGIDVTQVGWGYSRNDSEWKSPEYIVKTLTSTIARGGTFMMNVGPTSKGLIAPQAAAALRGAGKWISRYPEVVYGAGPSPWGHALPWGDAVTQFGKIYLIVYDWPSDGHLWLPGLKSGIRSAKLYGGAALGYDSEDGWTRIDVPFQRPDSYASVIEIETEGKPVASQNIAADPSVPSEFSVVFGDHDKCGAFYDSWMDKFGEWKFKHSLKDLSADTWLDWTVNFQKAGTYDVELEYKGDGPVLWQLEIDGKQVLLNSQKSANVYTWQRLGWIEIDNPGQHCICIRPVGEDYQHAVVSSIRLAPVEF